MMALPTPWTFAGKSGTEPLTRGPAARSAVVMGGGLAGMAAAVCLAGARWRVTLLESRKRLGGRATSHVEPGSRSPLDNCQHVLLGCCPNLMDLYARLGVAELIRWHDRLHFLRPGGTRDVLTASPRVPAPFHLMAGAARFGGLSTADKVAIARALAVAVATPASGRRRWHEESFGKWLARRGQSAAAVREFWDTVTVSALNDGVDRVNAACALQVFLQAFMSRRDAYRVGVPVVPLVRLYDAVERLVAASGGAVRLGTSIEAIVFDRDAGLVTGVATRDGETLTGDVYVSALPPDRLAAVCPDTLRERDGRFAGLADLTYSPTVGIHLRYDRPVLEIPHAALVGSPVQWVFSPPAVDAPASGDGGQTVRLVASAAHGWVDTYPDVIVREATAVLERYVPAARAGRVMEWRVIKERRATFRPEPGIERLRPSATGASANLYLAGDFCRTGWPATMEGAVRGGYLAAGAILDRRCLARDPYARWPFNVPAAVAHGKEVHTP